MSKENLIDITESILKDIKENRVVLYMKGSKLMPQCGFSARVVDILNHFNVEYITRDVLLDDSLREEIKKYSNWPTLPQLYIDQEFIGGCDIITELASSGELEGLLKNQSDPSGIE